ncbi:hypothetical protein C8R43DRAFT_411697 [Mycena crocata]|nr:hypothetical protein C8R43DRAFT_411697 [Mycena crocata]
MPRQTSKNKAADQSSRKRAKGKAVSSSSSPASTPTQRFRGRGQLKMLPEMPLDILFEIFSRLDPPDVLRLSRTTKDLRHVLMSRSAISIWKSAFLNDPDLPPVPDGLNEAQYANLAFSPHCHFCFTSGDHSILWSMRVRVCKNCVVNRFDENYKVLKKLPPGNPLSQNLQLLCYATVMLPSGIRRVVYAYEEAEAVNNNLVNLKKGDSRKLDAYIDERKKLVVEIQAHASKAEMSGALRLARRQRMLQEALDRRREVICNRLSDLGYEEEVSYLKDYRLDVISEHPLIKSHNLLTDRVWENMKPQLEELLQGVREKLQRRKRKSLLKQRQRLLLSVLRGYIHGRPIDEVNPRAVEVCVLPDIQAMVQNPSSDAYTTEDSFQNVLDDLPLFCARWRESKTQELMALLPDQNDRDFLFRATTYFRCDGCSEPIAYPRILAHACLYKLHHGHRNRDDDLALLCQNMDSKPWNCDGKRVSTYPAAEASAKAVIRACQLNTDMTTAQDLNDVNPWLECLQCRHVTGRTIFRWQKAILHDMYHAVSAETVTWRLLDEDDSDAAEALQQKTFETHYNSPADYTCTRCRQDFPFLQIRGHIRTSHNIDDPELEEDYVLQVDASMDQPPFPLILPHSAPKAPEVIEIEDDEQVLNDYIMIDDDE